MKPRATQLDGWKEIACHLKRSVRCVQRWARNEQLPVKRHRHRGGVSVYAFRDELDSWWRNEWSSSNESPSKRTDLSVRDESEGKREAAEGEGRIAGIDRCNTRNQCEIERIAWDTTRFFLWVLQALTMERASKELLNARGQRWKAFSNAWSVCEHDQPKLVESDNHEPTTPVRKTVTLT